MATTRRQGGPTRGGRDLRARVWSWYWRRRRARAGDPASFRRLLAERKAELDAISLEVEAQANASSAPEAKATEAVWSLRPACFHRRAEPGAWTDPPSGVRLDETVSVYHDGAAQSALAQRPGRGRGPNRFEIWFESYEFDGAYLSFVASIPKTLRRPRQGEKISVSLDLRASRPLKAFLRLHAQAGAGAETLYAEGELGDGSAWFDFDFSFVPFPLGADDTVWVDLILDRPRMVEFALRDFVIALEDAR